VSNFVPELHRRALPDVLSELHDVPRHLLAEAIDAGVLRVTSRGYTTPSSGGSSRYRNATADAIDRLHRAGLYPWSPEDPAAPRWWCKACDGCGFVKWRRDAPCEACSPR